ncbi:unnamed protein product [Ectocarpus sp. 6 AP-2014]
MLSDQGHAFSAVGLRSFLCHKNCCIKLVPHCSSLACFCTTHQQCHAFGMHQCFCRDFELWTSGIPVLWRMPLDNNGGRPVDCVFCVCTGVPSSVQATLCVHSPSPRVRRQRISNNGPSPCGVSQDGYTHQFS